MLGLTDEHIAHLSVPKLGTGTVGHEKFDPAYVLRRRPDCVVSTWMDEDGHAVSAGLETVTAELDGLYELVAVAKVKRGAPADGRGVVPVTAYSTELYGMGYQTELFCLRVK
jgi:hypothetical protein